MLCLYLLPAFWDLCGEIVRQAGYDPRNELLRTAAFIVAGSFIATIIDLPFDTYLTFVIEQKHGFNKQVWLPSSPAICSWRLFYEPLV